MLAANPKNSVSLRLQEEERDIKERLRLAGYGTEPIKSAIAVRPRDIQQSILDFDPQIIHFSGLCHFAHKIAQSEKCDRKTCQC